MIYSATLFIQFSDAHSLNYLFDAVPVIEATSIYHMQTSVMNISNLFSKIISSVKY